MATTLTWDGSGERFFETGVDHGVLFRYDKTTHAYESGVAWNGLTSVTESPDGAEATDLWADNIKYATLRSTETYGFTIEAYTYPDEFMACDGTAIPANGLYLGQQSRMPFGFSWRSKVGSDEDTDAEANYKLHIVYMATANPADREYESVNDNPDAITFSFECDTNPVDCTGYKKLSSITIDSRTADADALAALESKLYGNGTTTAQLPTPDEVLSLFGVDVDA